MPNEECKIWNLIKRGDQEGIYECEFDRTYFGNTIVTEWELICDRGYLASLTQTVFLIGTLSTFLVGYFSDVYGRRKVLVVIKLSYECWNWFSFY